MTARSGARSSHPVRRPASPTRSSCGAHAENNPALQEVLIAPAGFGRFDDALRGGGEIFHPLKQLLAGPGKATNVGDRGGFAPSLESADEAIGLVLEAIGKAGYKA